MAELKNLEVVLISLVSEPANKRGIIFKSTDAALILDENNLRKGNENEIELNCSIKKFDNEKGLLYGIVYPANDKDTYGDWIGNEELEKTAHNFLKRSNTHAVDEQHQLQILDGVHIAESWIVRENDALFPDDVGAWAVAIKVDNEEVRKNIKNGTYKGLSLYGFCQKVKSKEDSKISKAFKYIKSLMNDNNDTPETEETELDNYEVARATFEENFAQLNFKALIDAFVYTCYDSRYESSDSNELEEKLIQAAEDFKNKIATIEQVLKSQEIMKAGKTISDANMKKLQAAIEALNAILEAANSKEEKSKSKIIKMNKEEIKKEIDEAIEKAIEPVKAENETLKKELGEAKTKIEELEKSSKGSTQTTVTEPVETQKSTPVIPFTKGIR